MPTQEIQKELQKERARVALELGRLDAAIAALSGSRQPRKPGKAPKKTVKKRKPMSAANKRAIAARMKKYWKERKKKKKANK